MTDNNIIEGTIIDANGDELSDDTNEGKPFTVKGISKFVVRSSVKFVVAGAIASLAPEAESKKQKVKVAVGSYVLADMVAKSTGDYVEEKISEWKNNIVEVRDMVKKIESMTKTSNS